MKTLFILLVCTWVVYISKAQPLIGLDPSFANNGIYIGDTGIYGHIGVQSDGKIIVIGRENRNGVYENVKRLNKDGTVDNNFANNGFFTMSFPIGKLGGFNAIVFQSDDKIILGGGGDTGITHTDFLLARLQADGSFDSSFGSGGYTITSLGSVQYITAIALQPDGKIIAVGDKYYENEILIVRYNANGIIDSSFGIDGMVSSDISWNFKNPRSNGISIMSDGRIVIGAKANINSLGGASAFTAIRLLPNGELDTSFNHTGIAYTNANLGWLLYCKNMFLQPDGKVLLMGYADSMVIVRFDTLGQLDNTFGNGGIIKISGGYNIGSNVTGFLQSDGKMYISGQIDTSNYIYRREIDGSPDFSFGINGELVLYGYSVGAIITQTDARVLLAGMLAKKTAVARLMPNATSVSTAESETSLLIYPNPATNEILIENNMQHLIEQLCLYSTDGKLVLTQLHPATNRLSSENLANGIYYLKIHFSNSAFTQKIVIQKN